MSALPFNIYTSELFYDAKKDQDAKRHRFVPLNLYLSISINFLISLKII